MIIRMAPLCNWNFANNICLTIQFYQVWSTSVCREMNIGSLLLLLVTRTFKSKSFGMVAGWYQQQSGDRLVNLTQTAVNCRLSLLSCQLTVGLASSIVPLHQPLMLEDIVENKVIYANSINLILSIRIGFKLLCEFSVFLSQNMKNLY